jgi:branched-chain amino acid transport system ATP-binding protein
VPRLNGHANEIGGGAESRPLLELDGLTVRYGGVLALRGVTLVIREGAIVALIGPNGAGKTTTLRAIAGLLPFHRGRIAAGNIKLDGQSVAGRSASRIVDAGVASVLEGRRLFAELSVAENLRVGAFTRRARRRESARRAELLALFPILADRLDQRAGLMSGGEQQMVAIGRALMAQPRLLLLDEPSLGVAPLVVHDIAQALRRIAAAGAAVLLVTQDTALALAVSDHAYLLETGRTSADGPTRELLADARVRAAYLGVALRSQELEVQ